MDDPIPFPGRRLPKLPVSSSNSLADKLQRLMLLKPDAAREVEHLIDRLLRKSPQ